MEAKDKIDKETTENQDNFDKVYDMLKRLLDGDSSSETLIENLKDFFVDSSDKKWIQTADQVTKEAVLDKLRSEVVTNENFVKRKSLSPSEVIRNTSALTGKLFTKNVNEFAEQRKAVLQAHSEIKLMASRLPQTRETKEFQSRYQRDQFQKVLSAGGWGTAIAITAAYKAKDIGAGYGYENKQEDESEKVENRSATYFSRLSCTIIPTELWDPQSSDVSLSENALSKLRDIEKYILVQRDLAKTECEGFFREFGSHVYLKIIHLGGMYKIETTFESNQTTDLSTAKEMVASKHSESADASVNTLDLFKLGIRLSGHQDSGKVDETGTFVNTESSKVHTTESKVGGPQEVSIIPLWRKGMLSNNSTWVIVDNGKSDRADYTPVWELVQRQSQDFKNAHELVNFLIETWETFSGLSTGKHDVMKCLINSVKKQWKQVIERMTQCLSSDKDKHVIARLVCDLHDQVLAMEKTLDNTNIWQNEIKNNVSVPEFLNLVISQNFSEDEEIEVHRYTERLMKYSESLELPLRNKIHSWLQNRSNRPVSILGKQTCGNVEEFNSLLKKFLRSSRMKINERKSYVPPDFTLELEETVESVLLKLHQENKCSQILYLYSLLIPLAFDVIMKYFKVQVTLQDLEHLSKKLESGIPQFKDEKCRGEKWLQAWILRGLLSDLVPDSSKKERGACRREKESLSECFQVLQWVKNGKLNISDVIVKSLVDHDWGGDIKSLIESLSRIVDGKDEPNTKTIQWNYFERNSSSCYTDNKQDFIRKAFQGQPDNLTDQQGRAVIPNLVKTLKLSDYFPGKLTVQTALIINNKTPAQSACLEDLPWLMLQTILTGNFKFRENVLEDLQNKLSRSSSTDDGKQTNGNPLDMFAESDSEDETTDNSNQYDFHPLDILLVLYICCDAALKGLVAQKIFSCQLAIPFIHKDYLSDDGLVVSLWPLRGIVTTTSNHTEESVVTQETTILSFIRIGEGCNISKSKFINDILRDQSESHSTFYHRDCKFGMHRRTISDGMVEITWYLPSADRNRGEGGLKEPIAIQQPLTIFNMRGDAVKYRQQTDGILGISSIVVVFVEFQDLKNERYKDLLTKIHASDSYVILFTKMDQDRKVSKNVIQDHINLTKMDRSKTYLFSPFDLGLKREYNASERKEQFTSVISDKLAKTKEHTTLETAAENIIGKVYCDETNKNCSNGKKLARLIFSAVVEKEVELNRKEIFLPLQGERLWRQWTRLQKEDYRSGKTQSEEQKNKIWKEMKHLREAQVHKLNSSPSVVASFVETLIETIDQNETILYFLAWLKRFLDDESRRILPNLRKRLHNAFHDYQSMTKKSDSQMTYIEDCKDSLANASFGLEHFFRELAQIYEAFTYCKSNSTNCLSRNTFCLLEILPYLAAKLLLLGQPLELIDGDAANVPQKWTEAVFKAIEEVKEDKKLVSISVLGIQSSGKSTLLNTMFGLQFSVSAGRCTRGVYLQLLPIRGDSAQEGPSYAIIIDTEGLRAPESSGKTVTYDNELATLVIGLADIIIVNIKGETMGEMENVLQIVVHELLRLKQAHANLDLCQSVILVHQNISAQYAASHLDQGNLSIVTNLNKVTKEAASQACMSGIECFKDVIQFNSKDHVKYISDLWLGNPPMAPVNPRYCAQASEVVDAIFHDLVNNQQQFLTIKYTSLHFRNLWNAILAEDFVFSFCNGLQIKAYSLLENEYLKQNWRLEKLKMDWKIDNIEPKLKECKNETELSTCASKLIDEFRSRVESEKDLALEKMKDFIRLSDLKLQMAEWQESKKHRLIDNVDELIRTIQKEINAEKDHCTVALKQSTVIEERTKCLYQMATDFAKSLQGKQPSDRDKCRHFQDFWRKKVDDAKLGVQEEQPPERLDRIKSEIKGILYNRFKADRHLLKIELEKYPLKNPTSLSRLENCLDNRIEGKHTRVKDNVAFDSARRTNATEVVNLILRDIDKNCMDLLKTDVDYDKTQFSKILFNIKEGFSTHNNDDAIQFKLGPALEIMASVQAAKYACKIFEELSLKYYDKHSIIKQLQAYRPRAQQLFEDILDSKTFEIIAANNLCLEIKDILRERIERILQNDIESKIRMLFGNKKHAVIKDVLEELATVNNFKAFLTYISTPDIYIKQWLEELTNRIVFTKVRKKSYYQQQAIEYLSILIKTTLAAVTEATDKHGNENIDSWIQTFKELIKKEKLVLKHDAFKHVCNYDISNFKDFSNCIKEKLYVVEDELTQVFENTEASTAVWQEKSPYAAIFEALWGCVAKCPFCNEPCIKSDPNHAQDKEDVHRCIQHRPSGIAGVHLVNTKTLQMDSCSYLFYKDAPFLCGHWCQCTKLEENKSCTYSHNMRKYKTYQPTWEILSNSDSPSSKYWAWCMVQFSEPLADKYGFKAPDFPESWRNLKKEDALDSLAVYS